MLHCRQTVWVASPPFLRPRLCVLCPSSADRSLAYRLTHKQYSGKDNEKLEPTIDAQILSFTRLLSSKYLSSCDGPGTDGRVFRPVDLARKLQYLTLDVITSLAFGERFGFVDEDRDVHRYIEMTEQNMPVMLVLGCLPKLAVALQSPFFRWLLPSEHDRLGFGKFIG